MSPRRQILDAIARAAKSSISDHEFRALVVTLVQPHDATAVRKPPSARREPLAVPRPQSVRGETLAPSSPTPSASPNSTTYYYKLYRVKRADGRVTTVSLDPAVVTQASQRLGGPKEVGALVRKLAFDYRKTDDVSSCSRFVTRGLFTAIASISLTVGNIVP